MEGSRFSQRPEAKRKAFRAFFFLFGAFLFASLLGISFGATGLSLREAISLGPFSEDPTATIFFKMRIPRVLLAGVIGGSLAMAGAALQGLFRNPLATPFTLGVSGGASLGAVIGMGLGLGRGLWGLPLVSLFSFLFAMVTVLSVFRLAWSRGGYLTGSLLLAGVVANFFFSSIILFIQYRVDIGRSFDIMRWMLGSLETLGPTKALFTLFLFIPAWALLLLQGRDLNLLSFGEETATSLGVKVKHVTAIIYFATSVIVGVTVAAVGPIGFVGLVVPHLLRIRFGPDNRVLLPASIPGGAAFLVISDLIARTVASPTEIPVGVITALFGGPFFFYLLWRRRDEITL